MEAWLKSPLKFLHSPWYPPPLPHPHSPSPDRERYLPSQVTSFGFLFLSVVYLLPFWVLLLRPLSLCSPPPALAPYQFRGDKSAIYWLPCMHLTRTHLDAIWGWEWLLVLKVTWNPVAWCGRGKLAAITTLPGKRSQISCPPPFFLAAFGSCPIAGGLGMG